MVVRPRRVTVIYASCGKAVVDKELFVDQTRVDEPGVSLDRLVEVIAARRRTGLTICEFGRRGEIERVFDCIDGCITFFPTKGCMLDESKGEWRKPK